MQPRDEGQGGRRAAGTKPCGAARLPVDPGLLMMITTTHLNALITQLPLVPTVRSGVKEDVLYENRSPGTEAFERAATCAM